MTDDAVPGDKYMVEKSAEEDPGAAYGRQMADPEDNYLDIRGFLSSGEFHKRQKPICQS